MKIKVRPEDFQVEEVAHLPLTHRGPYRVYLLRKENWNTVDLLLRLSRETGIPFKEFSYGGKKDRYASTVQYITVRHKRNLSRREKNYSIESVGFMQRPMGPDLIKGNRFSITIRKLDTKALEKATISLQEVRSLGFPNYFDDQRFGSYDPRQGFIAEKIIKKHYNGALKIYLTHIHPGDKKAEKERKRFFFENWDQWQECQKKAKTSFEKTVFRNLRDRTATFIELLARIPKEEMSLFYSAYQSHLWNEILRKIVRLFGSEIVKHPGIEGDYLFYRSLKDKDDRAYLSRLTIPMPASKMTFQDVLTETLTMEVLKEKGLKPSSFNLKKPRNARFGSFNRKAIVYPEDLEYKVIEDDIYPGSKAMKLRFFLPRGSYATMLIKRLSVS